MNTLVLLLLPILFGFAEPTGFIFNGTVKCESDWPWYFKVEVYEADNGLDDFIGGFAKHVNGEQSVEWRIDEVSQVWDGILDSHMELEYHIDIKCDYPWTRKFQIQAATIHVSQRFFRQEMEIDYSKNRYAIVRQCDKEYCPPYDE